MIMIHVKEQIKNLWPIHSHAFNKLDPESDFKWSYQGHFINSAGDRCEAYLDVNKGWITLFEDGKITSVGNDCVLSNDKLKAILKDKDDPSDLIVVDISSMDHLNPN